MPFMHWTEGFVNKMSLFCLRSLCKSLRGAFLLFRSRTASMQNNGLEAHLACLMGGFLIALLAAAAVYGAGLFVVLRVRAHSEHTAFHDSLVECRYWTTYRTALEGILQRACRPRRLTQLLEHLLLRRKLKGLRLRACFLLCCTGNREAVSVKK